MSFVSFLNQLRERNCSRNSTKLGAVRTLKAKNVQRASDAWKKRLENMRRIKRRKITILAAASVSESATGWIYKSALKRYMRTTKSLACKGRVASAAFFLSHTSCEC